MKKIEDLIQNEITYLIGNKEIIEKMPEMPSRKPFSNEICAFLNDVSKTILKNKRARYYSDVVSFAFWIRKASLFEMKRSLKEVHKSHCDDSKAADGFRLGRGIVFHIAPSNVPVNFAFSLASGLLTGNANVVRLPQKDFEQTRLIVEALQDALREYKEMSSYIALVRYGHEQAINDWLSGMADARIIWGGDQTIAEIRKSPLPPRGIEIAFADRYSLAVIDSDIYCSQSNKDVIVKGFYNDTYFSDQNACTSPKAVVWIGTKKKEAKKDFWNRLHKLVVKKYRFQDIQSVNKLTTALLIANEIIGVKILLHEDNLIVRIRVPKLDVRLVDRLENSGFFIEYDCDDVMHLKDFCDNKRCQTVGILGNKEWLLPLIQSGIKGIDRIVEIGSTMDFELFWDGYDIYSSFTRLIRM